MERSEPISTARSLVLEMFPDALAAVLAGSTAAGTATDSSDLDVVVVLPGPPAPYRETVRYAGWPVELFVHTRDSLRHWYDVDRADGRGILAFLVATGATLHDGGDLASIRDEAQRIVASGPPALALDELRRRRYLLTEALDDLVGARDRDERDAVAGLILVETADLALRAAGRWTGRGKWLVRRLREHDPVLAARLLEAHRRTVTSGEPASLVAVVESVLEPAGGRLTEGYRVPPLADGAGAVDA